jgi:aspartyl-tRNA(Asn)/glutamyl-tRNA(Gln) amidotransferase subunit B
MNEQELKSIIEGVLNDNPSEVESYKEGQKHIMGMFMGKVMKISDGKADPKVTSKLIGELIS